MPANIPLDLRTRAPVREQDVQRAILQYLGYRGYVCWRNNSGAVQAVGANGKKRFFRFGEVGSGDIVGLTKTGMFFSIEVKRRGNVPTDAQRAFGERVVKSKGVWFVAYDVADVIARGF